MCASRIFNRGARPQQANATLAGRVHRWLTRLLPAVGLAFGACVLAVEPDARAKAVADAGSQAFLPRVAQAQPDGAGLVCAAKAVPRLKLDDLFNLAIQGHPDILAKRADLDAARAGQDAARWQYFPTPSLQIRQQEKGEQVSVAALQQPVWAGGRLDAGLDAANARARSAGVAIAEAQYALALRLTSQWQAWLQARGRAEALAAGVRLLNVYAQTVHQRIQGGVSPEVDRELVQSRLAQAQADLAAAQAAERSAVSQLSQLVGSPLRSSDIDPGTGAGLPAFNVPAFEVLAEQAVARSPALQRIEAEAQAARHDVAQKRAALWPTVGVRAEHQRGNITSSLGTQLQDNRIMLVLDFVPGAGLSAGAAIAAAEARVAGLRESGESARRELIARLAADYEDYRTSLLRRQDIVRTAKAAAEVLASYDRLFIAGKRNWLDVLNAARELTQVHTSQADIDALLAASHHRLRLHGAELSWQRREAP